MVYQVNTHGALCTTFDISAACQSMVFGDAGGIQFVLLLLLLSQNLGEIGNSFLMLSVLRIFDISDILVFLLTVILSLQTKSLGLRQYLFASRFLLTLSLLDISGLKAAVDES